MIKLRKINALAFAFLAALLLAGGSRHVARAEQMSDTNRPEVVQSAYLQYLHRFFARDSILGVVPYPGVPSVNWKTLIEIDGPGVNLSAVALPSTPIIRITHQ